MCPDRVTNVTEVFGEAGTTVKLDCGDIGSDRVVVWRVGWTRNIVGHHLGNASVYPDKMKSSPTKYVYSEEDYSLTVTDVSLKDETCYICKRMPSDAKNGVKFTVEGWFLEYPVNIIYPHRMHFVVQTSVVTLTHNILEKK